MHTTDPVIAIGLLTARDLDRLGNSFDRAFVIAPDDTFDDLLRKLERVEWRPNASKP